MRGGAIDVARQTMGDAIHRIKAEIRVRREERNSMCRLRSAYNWLEEKEKVTEKGSGESFLFRAHTVSVLIFLMACLVYVALFEVPVQDPGYNSKRGLLAAVYFWVALGLTLMPDGPFLRPHPALWRFAFSVSILYELILIFILFQTPSDARKLLKVLDERLGEPIPEKDYGGNCRVYDSAVPEDPYHNIREKVDVFITAHFFGYWCKTLVFRDWWLTTVISVMFEFLEYSLEHQLPNFSECWWDHWIMDVLICNGGGTLLGLVTLRYLSMKEYNWRGLWDIPTYRGKIKRIIAQFSPHGWIEFTWNPLSSLERWLAVLGIIVMFLVTELNTFYLKFILWVEPEHWINFVRLFFILLWGAVGLREIFQLLDDPECEKLGRQSWVLLAVISTELLICLKFGWETMTKPIPKGILLWWLAGILLVVVYTFIKFVILKPTKLPQPEKELCDVRRSSEAFDEIKKKN